MPPVFSESFPTNTFQDLKLFESKKKNLQLRANNYIYKKKWVGLQAARFVC